LNTLKQKTDNLKIQKTDYIAKITFSKPTLNVFDRQDLANLDEILQELSQDDKLRLIVFESDQKVFSAGVDIAEHLPGKAAGMLKTFNNLFLTLLNLEIPTLALVKGDCYGGGSEFAMFCDFTLASEKVCFCQPEIKLGFFPPLSLAHFGYLTGNKKALEMILTGEKMTASQALEAGFINHVFGEEEFDEKAEEFINSLAQNSTSVIRMTLKLFKKLNYQGIKERIELSEKVIIEELINLEDCIEGANSFLEKRLPVWKNR